MSYENERFNRALQLNDRTFHLRFEDDSVELIETSHTEVRFDSISFTYKEWEDFKRFINY